MQCTLRARRLRLAAACTLVLALLPALAGCSPDEPKDRMLAVGPSVREGPREIDIRKVPDWAMQGANAAHTGEAVSLGPEEGDVLWTVPVPVAGPAQPAVTADGTVYVAGENGGTWHLTAVSAGGQVLWTQNLGLSGPFTPAIGEDGTVYAPYGSPEPGLLAFSPMGGQIWQVPLHEVMGLPDGQPVPADPGLPSPSPVMHKDGLILLGAGPALAAVTMEGKLAWVWTAGAPGTARVGTPAVGPDGSIHLPVRLAPNQFALVQLSRRGQENWRYPLAGWGSTPVVGADGLAHLVVSRPDGTLQLAAVRINGKLRWERTLDWPAAAGGAAWPWGDAMPALTGGRCLVGIVSVDRDRQQAAALPAGFQAASPAALDTTGNLYVLAHKEIDWTVMAVSSDGKIRWTHALEAPGSYPSLGGERVYVVEVSNGEGRLVALGEKDG